MTTSSNRSPVLKKPKKSKSHSVPGLGIIRPEEVFAALFYRGSWFQFPNRFLFMMKTDAAVMLSFLINHGMKCTKKRPWKWFYCKVSTVKTRINMPARKQSVIFGQLRELGYLETERRGIPPKRWIRLNLTRICGVLMEGFPSKTVEDAEEAGMFDDQ